MDLDEVMERESLATKKEAHDFLLSMYSLKAPHTIRSYTKSLVKRWRSGITRQHLVELRVLYSVLGQLLGRIKDI